MVLITEWQDQINEAAIDEICSILSQLDMHVDSKELWHKLFEANEELGRYIAASGMN